MQRPTLLMTSALTTVPSVLTTYTFNDERFNHCAIWADDYSLFCSGHASKPEIENATDYKNGKIKH